MVSCCILIDNLSTSGCTGFEISSSTKKAPSERNWLHRVHRNPMESSYSYLVSFIVLHQKHMLLKNLASKGEFEPMLIIDVAFPTKGFVVGKGCKKGSGSLVPSNSSLSLLRSYVGFFRSRTKPSVVKICIRFRTYHIVFESIVS